MKTYLLYGALSMSALGVTAVTPYFSVDNTKPRSQSYVQSKHSGFNSLGISHSWILSSQRHHKR